MTGMGVAAWGHGHAGAGSETHSGTPGSATGLVWRLADGVGVRASPAAGRAACRIWDGCDAGGVAAAGAGDGGQGWRGASARFAAGPGGTLGAFTAAAGTAVARGDLPDPRSRATARHPSPQRSDHHRTGRQGEHRVSAGGPGAREMPTAASGTAADESRLPARCPPREPVVAGSIVAVAVCVDGCTAIAGASSDTAAARPP